MSILGENLKIARNSLGLTQQEVVDKINKTFNSNIQREMLSKWETGFQEPTIYYLSCLSRFYKISSDELLGNTPTKPLESYPKLFAADTSSHSPIFHMDETDITQHHKNMIAERIINSNYSDEELNKIEQMLDIIVPAQKK